MRTVAVVLADADRVFGMAVPKPLASLAGKAVIEYSVAAFETANGVDEVVVVVPAGLTAQVEKVVANGAYPKVAAVIEGGRTRPDCARQAIRALGGTECDVLFHDANRPLVGQRVIAECVLALRTHEAVCAAIPSSDTVVAVKGGLVASRPPRDRLRRRQTPQGFRLSVIRRGYERALADPDFIPTDDCGVVLRYLPEVPVRVVAGSEHNIKVTHPRDLAIAEILLKAGDGGAPGVSSAVPA
jgi:2-C-methyl-D-erythritol 4-phosphate cytidylyltransferase